MARFPLAHTHTLKHAWRLNEDINTQTTSPESLHERFTVSFHLISYTHRNVKVFTATRQNKSQFFEDIEAEIFVQQNVRLLLKLWKLIIMITPKIHCMIKVLKGTLCAHDQDGTTAAFWERKNPVCRTIHYLDN